MGSRFLPFRYYTRSVPLLVHPHLWPHNVCNTSTPPHTSAKFRFSTIFTVQPADIVYTVHGQHHVLCSLPAFTLFRGSTVVGTECIPPPDLPPRGRRRSQAHGAGDLRCHYLRTTAISVSCCVPVSRSLRHSLFCDKFTFLGYHRLLFRYHTLPLRNKFGDCFWVHYLPNRYRVVMAAASGISNDLQLTSDHSVSS